MSSKPLLLEGLVQKDREPGDGLIQEWRREKDRLESEVRVLRSQLEEAKAGNRKLSQSVKALRHTLGPLHTSLRALFGEIDLAVREEEFSETPATPQSNNSDPRWQSYKDSFPGAPARVIDALLSHRQMTITQVSKLLRIHYNTASDALSKLKGAGAVVKDGNIYRLNT